MLRHDEFMVLQALEAGGRVSASGSTSDWLPAQWRLWELRRVEWSEVDFVQLVQEHYLAAGVAIAALILISYVNWLQLLTAPFRRLRRRRQRKSAATPPSRREKPHVEIELSGWRPPPLETLFGRDETLAWLNACWDDETCNIAELVAGEGGGKSALVKRWLEVMEARDFAGAKQVFAWSFTHPNRAFAIEGAGDGALFPQASDDFFAAALRWFGYDAARDGELLTAEDYGEKLAVVVRRQRALLILDGLDNHQNAAGEITDAGLKALIFALAQFHGGLCVVTTRRAVAGLEPAHYGVDVRSRDLPPLSFEAAQELLLAQSVGGKESAFKGAFKSFGTAPLTLTLLAKYLRYWHKGALEDYRSIGNDHHAPWAVRRAERDDVGNRQLRPVLRILAAHGRRLADKPELRLLHLLGLSRDALDKETLLRLIDPNTHVDVKPAGFWARWFSRPNAYARIMQPLIELKGAEWPNMVARLWAMGLLWPEAGGKARADRLQALPVVRDYFAAQFKALSQTAWSEAHARLYLHYKRQTLPRGIPKKLIREHLASLIKVAAMPEARHLEGVRTVFAGHGLGGAMEKKLAAALGELFPRRRADMGALFAAVIHGVQAGQAEKAVADIYWPRIRRGESNFLATALGSPLSDLHLLAQFFAMPWQVPRATFSPERKAELLQWAAETLRVLGRLDEAGAALGAEQKLLAKRRDWGESARSALQLARLRLAYGNLQEAAEIARETIRLAARREDFAHQMGGLTLLGDALHQMGRAEEAEEHFREAEELQKTHELLTGELATLMRYCYADLLLAQGRTAEVMEKLSEAVRWQEAEQATAGPVELAMDELTLGQAYWVASLLDQPDGDLDEARNLLTAAIGGLHDAEDIALKARAYLVRAQFLVSQEEFVTASDDIEVAYDIAKNNNLRLILTDCHLETARILLAMGDSEGKASYDIDAAARIIEESGYKRRLPELENLYIALTEDV